MGKAEVDSSGNSDARGGLTGDVGGMSEGIQRWERKEGEAGDGGITGGERQRIRDDLVNIVYWI